MFIPEPGSKYFSIPDPGVKKHKAPDPATGSATMYGYLGMFYGIRYYLNKIKVYFCSTTGKPTRSFATERVSLDSV